MECGLELSWSSFRGVGSLRPLMCAGIRHRCLGVGVGTYVHYIPTWAVVYAGDAEYFVSRHLDMDEGLSFQTWETSPFNRDK